MFRGLRRKRLQIKSVSIGYDIGASHGAQVSKLQFSRGITGMAAADGAAGATAKTLKLENARNLLRSQKPG